MISRVLGLRAGSAFTFAAATPGEETAPGQIAARTLLETYRVDQVDAATKVYGVAGNPIGLAFAADDEYGVSPRDGQRGVSGAADQQGRRPVQAGARDSDPGGEHDDAAEAGRDAAAGAHGPASAKIGAVNTILRAQDGKFYGFNTDVAGIVARWSGGCR